MRELFRKLVDGVLFIPTVIALPLLWALGRLRSQSRITRILTDFANIAVVRRHYYEPIVFQRDLKSDLAAERAISGLKLNPMGQIAFIDSLTFGQELAHSPMVPRRPNDKAQFYFQNGSFGCGDAEIYYNIIRRFKPARIIEVGSGYSSVLAQQALRKNREQDAGYTYRHICIEPFENTWLESVGAEIERKRVEDCPLSFFQQLEAGDILFIDSTHMIRPQGDVLFEILSLIGTLKKGVLIHVHDIFTPRDYPKRWVLGDRRFWNEQYLLEAYLCFNESFEVVAAVNWLKNNHFDLLCACCPVLAQEPTAQPGSFWFQKIR
jgi:hypothetical protein